MLWRDRKVEVLVERRRKKSHGKVIIGVSIMLFALIVGCNLTAGTITADTLPFFAGVGLFCLCGVGFGFIVS